MLITKIQKSEKKGKNENTAYYRNNLYFGFR